MRSQALEILVLMQRHHPLGFQPSDVLQQRPRMTPKEVDELLEEMVEEGNLEVNRLQEPHFYTHKKRK
jgi:DNA-binding IclR family transcriptional regulator